MSDESDYEQESEKSQESENESIGSSVDQAVNSDQNIDDLIDDYISSLMEKSPNARERGLGSLRRLILINSGCDYILDKADLILDYCLKSLKKGGESEKKISIQLIGSLFLLIGGDNEEKYRTVYSPLKDAIRDLKTESIRVACLRSLSFSCFVASMEADSTFEILKLFEDVFSKNENQLVSAVAIESWVLIASTIDEQPLLEIARRVIKVFRKHLSASEIELRIASGSAIAFIAENLESNNQELISDDLIDEIEELSKDSDRKKSKKEKNRQRSIFRDIVSTLERSTPEIEKLTFQGDVLVIDSWSKYQRINAVRNQLGGKITTHFQTNETLRDMFDMPPPTNSSKISSDEKKAHRKQNIAASKQRNITRNQKRQNKISRSITED